MIFLQPLALFALAFALVPPLLHLFQRRHPPDVAFPAVRYLRQTEREAHRAIRLRHVLVLLLRVAAVVLLVLAAARPAVSGRAGGLHAPTAVALVLDHSLSSGAVVGGRRVADDLAARARETLREAREGDALWLIGSDGAARRGSPAELIEAISAARSDARRLDVVAAVALGARLVRGAGAASAEVHVLSDLQRSALEGARGALETDSAAAGLAVVVYHPAGDPPANRGIAAVRVSPSVWVLGSGTVTAVIGGGPEGAGRAGVTVRLAGREVARASAAPGEAVTARASAARRGWLEGEVALEPDELRADDRSPFVVRAAQPVAVTLEPGADVGRFVPDVLGALASAGQVALGAPAGVRVGETPRSGAALVFPPRDAAQLGAANRALDAVGAGWRFGTAVAAADSVVAPDVEGVTGARVTRRYRLEPAGGTGRGTVLARVGGAPWIVRGGRTVIAGSRFVPEETDLPLRAGFVPAVAALLAQAARGDEGVVTARPGETVRLPAGVEAMATADGRAPATGPIVAPVTPGAYALLAGGDTVGALVVSPDPRESDLARAGRRDLAGALPGARLRVVDTPRAYAAARFAGAGRSDLTPWLLAAALVVLVAESLAAAGVRRAEA